MGELIEVKFKDNDGQWCIAIFDDPAYFAKFMREPISPEMENATRLREIRDAIAKQLPARKWPPIEVSYEHRTTRSGKPNIMTHDVILNNVLKH